MAQQSEQALHTPSAMAAVALGHARQCNVQRADDGGHLALRLGQVGEHVRDALAQELPALLGRDFGHKAIGVGMAAMIIFALLGNLPMLAGTDILKATTISGTMVIGLAPVFLLHGLVRPTRLGFHLSFWTGLALGVALTVGWIPASWAIGDGKYALLLGANLYGLLLCTAGYLLPGLIRRAA